MTAFIQRHRDLFLGIIESALPLLLYLATPSGGLETRCFFEIPVVRLLLPLSLLSWLPSIWLARKARRWAPVPISSFERLGLFFTFSLLAVLLSVLPTGQIAFFVHWILPEKPFHSQVLVFLWGVGILAPLLLCPAIKRRLPLFLAILFIGLQLYLVCTLLQKTDGGAMLYRDDHPSFLFRIHEMIETYPSMTCLNPWWNGGVVNSVEASSGTGAIVLPLYPLWRFLPNRLIYTPALAFYFIIVQPFLIMASLRAVRASWTTSLVGAILGLGAMTDSFLWTFHFGTIGASFAMTFLPLFAALTFRICVMRRDDLLTLLALFATAFLLCQWPPCAIMALSFSMGWLLTIRRFRLIPHLKLVIVISMTTLLLLPNILSILDSKELMEFVKPGTAPASRHVVSFSFSAVLLYLQGHMGTWVRNVHPLVLFFGLGAFTTRRRKLNRWFGPSVLYLILIAAWGPAFAKEMQLERMILPAVMLLIVPAAVFCGRLLRLRFPFMVLPQAMIIMLLLCGGTSLGRSYRNRGYAPYTVLPCGIEDFVETIREVVPEDGRLLFYGKVSHSYGTGHIAYLPVLSQREMLSCDYYGFPKGMVEFDYPPDPWRRTHDGLATFMHLVGATHITTSHKSRADFLRESPLFKEIPFASEKTRNATDKANRLMQGVSLFALTTPAPGRFHAGSGVVRSECGRLVVSLDKGVEEATIRYRWHPTLTADHGSIRPVEVAEGVTFIGVRADGTGPVVIRNASRFRW